MNIHPESGEVEIEEGGLVIRTDISLDAFIASSIGASARVVLKNYTYTTYSFSFKFDGALFGMNIVFESQRLDSARLEKLHPGGTWGNWSEAQELERKKENDNLLISFLGKPPYKFLWGEIVSTYDPRSGSANINIQYRNAR